MEKLKDIIQDEQKTDNGAREVQEQVEDHGEFLNLDHSSLVLYSVLIAINNESEHECLGETVRLLYVYPIPQLNADQVSGNN